MALILNGTKKSKYIIVGKINNETNLYICCVSQYDKRCIKCSFVIKHVLFHQAKASLHGINYACLSVNYTQ